MKNIIQLAIPLLIIVSMSSCSWTGTRDDESIADKGECSAPLTKWMEVSTGYNSKELVELAGKFKLAAKTDADKLKAVQASAGLEFSSEWKRAFEKVAQGNKKAQVSRIFFERAQAYRQAVCNLERQIKEKIITGHGPLEKAQNLLIKLSDEFGSIAENPGGQTVGINEIFLKPKEESQNLWNDWVEAKSINKDMSAAHSSKYLALGNSISLIDDANLNPKTMVMKYDRASLMFYLASEIIISSNTKQDEFIGSAITASSSSAHSASHGIDVYNKIVNNGPTEKEREWLTREEPNLVLLQRKAEALAQLSYLEPSKANQYNQELDNTLSALSCEYINKYKLGEEEVFTRIPLPQTIVRCRAQ